ncbi:hypothetical protein PVAND_014763 [Polypedilum vanderplanki]|uniref:Uncharacterized protein n=1 Tax=Polypedilum vanderplanki TaxID=319348 RepID=A0A9J6BAN7_POLVA|nr:hypothetical protein PVAND_014763 [Polypedilum vanderplanki]
MNFLILLFFFSFNYCALNNNLISLLKGVEKLLEFKLRTEIQTYFGKFEEKHLKCFREKLNLTNYDQVEATIVDENDESQRIVADLVGFIIDFCTLNENYEQKLQDDFIKNSSKKFDSEQVECYKQLFMRLEPESKLFEYSNENFQNCLERKKFEFHDKIVNQHKLLKTCKKKIKIEFELKEILEIIVSNTEEGKEELVKKSAKFLYNDWLKLIEVKINCEMEELRSFH